MEQRNLLLAIVVSVGILIGFQYLFEKLRPPPPPTPAVPTQTVPTPAPGASAPGSAAPGTTAPGNVPAATASSAAPGPETREQAVAEQPRVKIDTPRLHGSVALIGGRIDDL